jgi:hypothetical protein
MDLGLNLAMTNWDTGVEPNVGLAQDCEAAILWPLDGDDAGAPSTLAEIRSEVA